jgi:hypothetical protein
MGVSPNQFYPVNLLSHDEDPDWKLQRWPFADVGAETIDKMQAGYLVKFNAAHDGVEPALAADDALLDGIIVDKPEPNTTDNTVAVALSGSFNKNQIHYANAHAEGSSPTPLSAAAISRLRTLNIFLDDAVPAQPFAP